MTRIAIIAATALLAAPAIAQEDQSDLREAAESYVESQAMQTAIDEILSTDTFVAQLQATGAQLSDQQIQTIAGIIDEEFEDVRPNLQSAMTTAAVDAFTLEELEALNEFYESEEGQSVAEKMQPFMQSFYREIGPTLRETQQDIAMRVQEEMAAGEGGAGDGATSN